MGTIRPLGDGSCRGDTQWSPRDRAGTGTCIHDPYQDIREPRLGEGIACSARISDVAYERTVAAVRELIAEAHENGAEQIIVFGTEVFRRAENGKEVAFKLGEAIGFEIKILTSEEEARYSFIGGISGLPEPDGRCRAEYNVIIDVGGGSTEIAFGRVTLEHFNSLPIGAVVLAESCGAFPPISSSKQKILFGKIEEELDKLSSIIQGKSSLQGGRGEACLARVSNVEIASAYDPAMTSRTERFIGIGGTITTLAALREQTMEYRGDEVHGVMLTRSWLEGIFQELVGLNDTEIARMIPFAPARAKILPAGTAVFLSVMERLGADELIVSDRGARWGMLLSLYSAPKSHS